MFCFLEGGDGHFTGDGRKALEKVFECFSAFEIVEQRLDRDAGAAKDRSSAEDLGIFDDDSHGGIVSREVGHPRAPAAKTGEKSRKRASAIPALADSRPPARRGTRPLWNRRRFLTPRPRSIHLGPQ